MKTDPSEWKNQLSRYYEECTAYHAMTASGDKTSHPQVRLLQCLVKEKGCYLEVGCGSGVVCRTIAPDARKVTGVDCSNIAVDNAVRTSPDNCSFRQSDACSLPYEDSSFDGVYSFEVLEHILAPEKAIEQILRVLRPGGFVLLSIPNRFSLDMHIRKNALPRFCDIVFASVCLISNQFMRRTYRTIKPDLVDSPYPDCDMITAVFPDKLVPYLQSQGCKVVFCDTYYMRAQAEGSTTGLDYRRKAGHWFYKYFGDHILLLATKGNRL